MKHTSLIIILLASLFSCSPNEQRDNRFELFQGHDSIPILRLNYFAHPDSTRKQMNTLYGMDLCSTCNRVAFRLPIELEGKERYLKVLVDFGVFDCVNCPPFCGVWPPRFHVVINSKNQILAEYKIVERDALEAELIQFFTKDVEDANQRNQLDFDVIWDKDADSNFVDSVFAAIAFSHLHFVENKLAQDSIDLQALDANELAALQVEYPLNILILSGFRWGMAPPPLKYETLEPR
ncbi:MAG: hypothetical protein ACI83I_001157 [Bacteroidia bacterium]|jgi:hypothetical protein